MSRADCERDPGHTSIKGSLAEFRAATVPIPSTGKRSPHDVGGPDEGEWGHCPICASSLIFVYAQPCAQCGAPAGEACGCEPLPTCAECGDPVKEGKTFCSDACRRDRMDDDRHHEETEESDDA